MRKRRKEEQRVSHKPSNLAFKQQRLLAWQPVFTPRTVLPWFFVLAVIMIPIGIGLLVAVSGLQEIVIDYTNCLSPSGQSCYDLVNPSNSATLKCTCTVPFTLEQDFDDQVFMYYRLDNYAQTPRRYVRSRDDHQMHGYNSVPNAECSPLNTLGGLNYAPCGFAANSMFNDTIQIADSTGEIMTLSPEGINWDSDYNVKFRGGTNASAWTGTLQPPNWNHPVWNFPQPPNTSPQLSQGFKNQDFINWMRAGALKHFRKLYRKIVSPQGDGSLSQGNYTLQITYNYPVSNFGGSKAVVLATVNTLGGKNNFMGVCYIVLGSASLVFGALLLAKHAKYPRQLGDDKYMTWQM
eukprot:comp18186_c0_seq1/m.19027 comp18186_c0_seq1/g.19027  ORF comp18186_c0_seq1/g.19027 comp18186_c0_seq1/m.19027 type:complete len:350 (-) comp18186_c0_seq1:23-1072(-)